LVDLTGMPLATRRRWTGAATLARVRTDWSAGCAGWTASCCVIPAQWSA